MGGCFSDVKGGKEAVGMGMGMEGFHQGNGNGGHNDAVHHFYTAQGFQPMFTQVQVRFFSVFVFIYLNLNFLFSPGTSPFCSFFS